MNDFSLSGKVIRMARLMVDMSIVKLSEKTGIYHNTIAMIERGERGISKRNEFRIIRELRRSGVSDEQLVSLQLITEYHEGKFEE